MSLIFKTSSALGKVQINSLARSRFFTSFFIWNSLESILSGELVPNSLIDISFDFRSVLPIFSSEMSISHNLSTVLGFSILNFPLNLNDSIFAP